MSAPIVRLCEQLAAQDPAAGSPLSERTAWLAAGCATALVSALGVVLSRKPVHGAVSLLVHSLSLAALYLVLSAQFVAAAQVIIYSGAIVVLFLFVVLLLPQGGAERPAGTARSIAAGLAAATLLVALGAAAVRLALPASAPAADGSVAAVGRSLFGPLLVTVELTTLPLLLAIVGAVTLWRRQEQDAP